MSAQQTRAVAIFIILMGIAIAGILLVRHQERAGGEPESGVAYTMTSTRVRTIAEADKAGFISIILYQGENPSVSYMAAAGTAEFDALSAAMAKATPVPGESDESFSDLLVISFGRGDTLYVSYSGKRNLLMVDNQVYQPDGDIQKTIDQVQSKMD